MAIHVPLLIHINSVAKTHRLVVICENFVHIFQTPDIRLGIANRRIDLKNASGDIISTENIRTVDR